MKRRREETGSAAATTRPTCARAINGRRNPLLYSGQWQNGTGTSWESTTLAHGNIQGSVFKPQLQLIELERKCLDQRRLGRVPVA